MIKTMARNLKLGLLIILVVSLILYGFVFVGICIENLWDPLWQVVLGKYVPFQGIIATLILAFIFGSLFTSEKISPMIVEGAFLDRILRNIPFVRFFWREGKSIKQNIDQFQEEASIVLVEWPKEGYWIIGFLSGYQASDGNNGFYRVFIPNTPLPYSGFIELIEAEIAENKIRPLNISFREAIKLISSGGFLNISQLETKRKLENKNGQYKKTS